KYIVTILLSYEYPLNERLRTLLRLEALFSRFAYLQAQLQPIEHHFALQTFFDIIEVCNRSDVRGEILKELERQRQTLLSMSENPNINQDRLRQTLLQFDEVYAPLHQQKGKLGQHAIDNEWLVNAKSRILIPGGTCDFDLPPYHAWLHHSSDRRRSDLSSFLQPFEHVQQALKLVLKLLRQTGAVMQEVAQDGLYERNLAGRAYHLVHVDLKEGNIIPEISANKYVLRIRFMTQPDIREKPQVVNFPLHFELKLCIRMPNPPIVKCPTCQKKVIWQPQSLFRPFCSERCKNIDLAAWASGDYTIPVVEMDDVSMPDEDDRALDQRWH
ncbi:unnamed protein product, partial [Darwinula stevensoni]